MKDYVTKTSIATEAYQRGDTAKALSIFKTFRIGFSKEESKVICIAHECLTGKASFYKQLGKDVDSIIAQAKTIIETKYNL